jgi:hypothetical protein
VSDSIWTRKVGVGPEWKSTKLTELTGEQLATAVRAGILRAAGVLALLSLLAWFVIGLAVTSFRSP